MQINKNDLVKFAANIQSNNLNQNKKTRDSNANRPENNAATESINIDRLRDQAMTLQKEISDLQTGLSYRQVQVAFLDTIQDNSNWSEELQRFMAERFPGRQRDSQIPEVTLEEFQRNMGQEVQSLSSQLIEKEVRLQNVFSAGINAEAPENISEVISRDFDQSQNIFGKLRSDSVRNLLNS